MLSLLRNHPGHALASAFRLRPSVLPLSYVATRHFLTTTPSRSPTAKVVDEANSNPSHGHQSDGKPDVKSKKKSPAKPKRFMKKDFTPPTKRPLFSFAAFAQEYRTKQLHESDPSTPVPLVDTLRNAATAWANLSEDEKQAYIPSPEAIAAHKLALQNWKDSLSPEVKKALKIRRRRERGTGHALFISETFKDAAGNDFGEKASDRAAAWKSLSSEEKAAYTKRAAETSFGVRARRAAQHEKQLLKEATKKTELDNNKKKEKARKAKEQAKKKSEAAKLKRQAKKEKAKTMVETLKRKEEIKRSSEKKASGKKTVEATA